VAKECSFNIDGTYTEVMYNNTFKANGSWALNGDKTKFGLSLNSINGLSVPVATGEITLVYGSEGYYGNNMIYGHDDSYFIKAK
jgi:hypothetical protein